MSLWWAKKEQLDEKQVEFTEDLSLRESHLVLGPPGSGKTNVLVRRAQFVRTQSMPNVLVLTFTRPLTEFIKTGCYDAQGREIFPPSCVSTLETWIRDLYDEHETARPAPQQDFNARKAAFANGAIEFVKEGRLPRYDALFVDEAQDLLPEEVELVRAWSPAPFFVGDDRQRIYNGTNGLEAVRALTPKPSEHLLPFHYRLAPEICDMADKMQIAQGNSPLGKNSQYTGPKPGHIEVHGPLSRDNQVTHAKTRLADQLRAYGDLIKQGDRLAIIVAHVADRDFVFEQLEDDFNFAGKSQIIRSRTGREDGDFNPEFDPHKPISILSEKGCKGLEFRAVHWLFCDEGDYYRTTELSYTVVTRAKTSIDLYHGSQLPQTLARSYSAPMKDLW